MPTNIEPSYLPLPPLLRRCVVSLSSLLLPLYRGLRRHRFSAFLKIRGHSVLRFPNTCEHAVRHWAILPPTPLFRRCVVSLTPLFLPLYRGFRRHRFSAILNFCEHSALWILKKCEYCVRHSVRLPPFSGDARCVSPVKMPISTSHGHPSDRSIQNATTRFPFQQISTGRRAARSA